MKLYIVKYCANEFDDLGYVDPYPIFYSLDKDKAREFFEDNIKKEINYFNDWIKTHPEFEHNEDYQIHQNEKNYFEYYMGNWFYQYMYEEQELDKYIKY